VEIFGANLGGVFLGIFGWWKIWEKLPGLRNGNVKEKKIKKDELTIF
jgi:hypothetical protein